MFVRTPFRLFAIALSCLISQNSLAEAISVEYIDTLSLTSLTDTVYQQLPEQRAMQAIQQQSEAAASLSNATFAGQSVINLAHQNDAIGSGDGLQEWESSIDVPLWLPQQKQTLLTLSQHQSGLLSPFQDLMRLHASAIVRDKVAQVLTAETQSKQTYEAWQTAITLKQDVDMRIEAGELASSEAMLAQAHVFEQQQSYLSSQASLKQALDSYAVSTGMMTLPQQVSETESTQSAINSSHPKLAVISSQIAQLRAAVSVAKYDGSQNPNLSLGVRRERQNNDEDFNNSLGLGISFGLGSNTVYQAQAVADAASDLADAEIEYQRTEHDLIEHLATTDSELASRQQQLELALQQQQITLDYLAVQKKLFQQGEIELAKLIQAQSLANNSHNQTELLTLEINQLIAQRNQDLGISL